MKWAESFAPYADGEKAPLGGLSDEALLKRLRNYKRQVAKRYRVIDPEQIDRLLSGGPYHVSAKYDGELWFLLKRGDSVAFTTFNGRVVHKTSLAREAEKLLAGQPDMVVAGELVGRPLKGDEGRSRVYHVATALGADELESTLVFKAFDLIELDGKDTQLSDYAPRFERLGELFGKGDRVTPVETEVIDASEVSRLYREWVVSDRYEGIVVRSDRGITYKIKSTLTLDATVIAFGERVTGEVHQVREMSVALLREDGTWQLLGAVGNGFSEQDRAAWHGRLSQLEVPSRFRLANREGTLSKFVKPSIIVEIRCSDLLAQDSWDAPIRRMSLSYSDADGWAPVAETPTAVMIHPIFLRERTDKTVGTEHVGMTQLTAHVPLETPGDDATRATHKPAEIVRRGVYTKTTKGVVAVRKYALIDTHKGGDRNYPPFVTFFTDYSPGRKEPLKTTLRSASTADKAIAQVEEWLGENIKRGWSETESARVGDAIGAPIPAAPAAKKAAKKTTKKTAKKTSKAAADET